MDQWYSASPGCLVPCLKRTFLVQGGNEAGLVPLGLSDVLDDAREVAVDSVTALVDLLALLDDRVVIPHRADFGRRPNVQQIWVRLDKP